MKEVRHLIFERTKKFLDWWFKKIAKKFSYSASVDSDKSANAHGCLKLKGQMLYVTQWESMIFLATPV